MWISCLYVAFFFIIMCISCLNVVLCLYVDLWFICEFHVNFVSGSLVYMWISYIVYICGFLLYIRRPISCLYLEIAGLYLDLWFIRESLVCHRSLICIWISDFNVDLWFVYGFLVLGLYLFIITLNNVRVWRRSMKREQTLVLLLLASTRRWPTPLWQMNTSGITRQWWIAFYFRNHT